MNEQLINAINRRTFLKGSSYSVGSAALAYLLSHETQAASKWKGVLDEKLHFAPKAKRVIHLCMAGGPSHLETLDHKPELARLNGKPMPESFTKGQQLAQRARKDDIPWIRRSPVRCAAWDTLPQVQQTTQMG